MEQYKPPVDQNQGDESVEEKPRKVPIQEDMSNNQEKFKIPEDVKLGTAEMVGCELRNSILRTEELLKKNPDNEGEKERLEDYKLQEAMLNTPVINIERRKKINEENSEELSEKQLQEIAKNFSAMDISDLVEEHFISRFMKTKREEGSADDLDEYHSNLPKTDIEELLRAAKALKNRLDSEDIRATNKVMDEINKEKEMAAARQKIEDINPDEAQKNNAENDLSKEESELIKDLKDGCVFSGLKKQDFDFLSEEQIIKVAQEGVISSIRKWEIERTLKIIEVFDIPNEFLQSEKVKKSVREKMINSILLKKPNEFKAIINSDCLPDVFWSSEIQKIVIEKIVTFVKTNKSEEALKFIERFDLSEKTLQSPEIQKVAVEKTLEYIRKGKIFESFSITSDFEIDDKKTDSSEKTRAATKGTITLLEKPSFNADDYEKILNIHLSGFLNLPYTFFSISDFDSAAGRAFDVCVKNGDIKTAKALKEKFNISKDIPK